ncbi:hypothetical protein [uncultured Methylophaga sp.]|uniref:hypothetical protein n=1 Tax=uncultured Methylophaga sp. TaxID=285271 RepID=UPI002609452D|nr:hypothetical protein [uncultured Methylophaga sp.]
MKKLLLTLYFLVAVIGCAKPYLPPSEGSLASIKFINEKGFNHIDTGNSCATRRQPEVGQWLKVRANKPVWIEQGFDTSQLPYGIACVIGYRFTPEENTRYEAHYILNGVNCHIELYEILDSGKNINITMEIQPVDLKACWY